MSGLDNVGKRETLKQQIAELRLLLSRATPGPWRSCIEARGDTVGDSVIQTGDQDFYLSPGVMPDDHVFDFHGGVRYSDQDLIATSRNYLPGLLDELERLLNQQGQ